MWWRSIWRCHRPLRQRAFLIISKLPLMRLRRVFGLSIYRLGNIKSFFLVTILTLTATCLFYNSQGISRWNWILLWRRYLKIRLWTDLFWFHRLFLLNNCIWTWKHLGLGLPLAKLKLSLSLGLADIFTDSYLIVISLLRVPDIFGQFAHSARLSLCKLPFNFEFSLRWIVKSRIIAYMDIFRKPSLMIWSFFLVMLNDSHIVLSGAVKWGVLELCLFERTVIANIRWLEFLSMILLYFIV